MYVPDFCCFEKINWLWEKVVSVNLLEVFSSWLIYFIALRSVMRLKHQGRSLWLKKAAVLWWPRVEGERRKGEGEES